MEFSRYLRTRERDGWTVVFHELHPDPVYCRSDDWKTFLHNFNHPLFARLVERKLIVSDSSDDDAEFALVYDRLMRKLSQPTILYLMLARGCNFGCRYCPVPRLAEKFGDTRLTLGDAQAGLRLWSRHLAEGDGGESFIIFYGGEPLLNKSTFQGALSLIDQMRNDGELPNNVSLMLATNGVLIDDMVIEACLKYDVLVALGLDGPKDANDQLRVYADGRGSFDDITAKLRLLNERGVRTAVSASITPLSVDRLDELTAVLRDLSVHKFGLNFLRGKALIELLPEGGRVDFERAAAAAVMRRHRDGNDDSYEYQVEKKVLAFRQRDFFPQDCTCYGNQLVIRPDGRVANCPFSETDFGHVKDVGNDFRVAKTELVATWRGRLPLLHPAFHTSDAKSLCGPGCASGAIETGGDVLAPDVALAEFSAGIFDELIWSEFTGG